MLQINGARLLADLRRLAEFGKYKTGVDRIAFSPADVEARLWLRDRLAEIGLTAATDRYGNVLGTWADAERAVLIGSHTDTVPRGGWLDGALGVVYALEIARAARESGAERPVGIDVISFQDEEGTYLPCLGSKSYCGGVSEADLAKARRTDGDPLLDALDRAGFSGEPLRAPEGRHVAFLEAHIEQGPRLLAAGSKVAVITGYAGIRRMTIQVHGRADHAGTTPMSMRKDAGAPLFRFAAWVGDTFPSLGGAETAWNIGNVVVEPGAANVVPSRTQLSLEFRDGDLAVLDRIEAAVRDKLAAIGRDSGVEVGAELTARIPPTRTDAGLQKILAEGARAAGTEPLVMQSGAGHDCMFLGAIMPASMIFIPSIGGRSHDIDENTDDSDIVFGCQALANAVQILLDRA